MKHTIVLQKSDFTEYAVSIGLWDSLTEETKGIEEVEIEFTVTAKDTQKSKTFS